MEFKVGDKVKILNTEFGNKGKIGTITNISGSVMIYFVEIEGDCGHVCQWSNASDLELVEEEKVVAKVGDKVQIDEVESHHYRRCGIVTGDDFCETFPYTVEFEDGDDCIFNGKDLIVLSTEEVKVMKFKVGDKVKVKDSWFGFTGEVGLIVRIDGPAKYPYRVKFDVVDEEDEELFAEGSLELVKGKDNHPSLKQAYKSLLEIQKELTTLEESMMRTVRHTRTEIARNEEELAELESKILEAAKQ